MRILSVTLQNYRVHHQKLTLNFDRERTVIGGPNESGKSTLVEAIHRALFLRARTTGIEWDKMKSTLGSGHPEVSLTLEIGEKNVLVSKRFGGGKGTTTLIVAADAALHDEAAEEEIARLLRVAPAANFKAADAHWAHLWVRQGTSGNDPAEHANQQRDSLIQRLGETDGAAAVAQSTLDSELAKHFANEVAKIFTQRGEKAKVDSPLAKAETELGSVQKTFDEARLRLEKLSQARDNFLHATAELDRIKTDFVTLKREQDAAEAADLRVRELRRIETLRQNEAEKASAAEKDQQKIEQQISLTKEKLTQLDQALGPAEKAFRQLQEDHASAQHAADAALQTFDQASRAVAGARAVRELAQLEFIRFAQTQRRDELRATMAQIEALEKELQTLRDALAKRPKIDAAQLKALETTDRDAAMTEASLRALAASIELVSGNQPVRIGGQPLALGKSETVTETAEILIGDDVRLRIRPGGGTTLADAQRASQDARERRTREQTKLNVSSLTEARDIFSQRTELLARIEKAETRRKDLSAGATAEKRAQAEEDVVTTESAITRRRASLATAAPSTPASEAEARLLDKKSTEQLTALETAEQRARQARDLAAQQAEKKQQAFTQSEAALRQQKSAREVAQGQLDLLTQTHGDEAARASRLTAAVKSKLDADTALAETRRAIATEQPDLLEATMKRLKRAFDEAVRRQAEAERTKTIAETELRSDGSIDPENDLSVAAAAKDAVMAALESIRRHAQAIKLLDELFREEQQSLATTFTRPLVETASQYLRALYGPETKLDVTFADGAFSDLRLTRPSVAAGAAIVFSQLSGGTKEQVAVALRLAMAEILAVDHGGTLPLILDDAFVNADPERVSRLQVMLDVAASRGLQVIVITCTPTDYHLLGALQLSLGNTPRTAV
jgi:DNA repair exonuclease SbcCD ATPase subunit